MVEKSLKKLKKLLIITPLFPPINSPDTQRVRVSIRYFRNLGWDPIIVTVNHLYAEGDKDEILLESIPNDISIIQVKALPSIITRKIGLGNIGLRSIPYYLSAVNNILKKEKFDLIYFSTTQFPICILGAYWKKKFGIPYIIDIQDPWHSDYYQDKPKHERPAKYWFSYRLNKWLEPMAMKNVDGLIAVSEQYNIDLKTRYNLKVPTITITFGAFEEDITIAKNNRGKYPALVPNNEKINVGYIGRGGHDMQNAIKILFDTFKEAKKESPEYFNQFHFNFLGTSYAPKGQGKPSIAPVATNMSLANFVTENTDRIPFYQTINTLAAFDILFICGSNDEKYTASKIYPYLLLEKPLLAIFHKKSSAVEILNSCSNATVITFQQPVHVQNEKIKSFFKTYAQIDHKLNRQNFTPYTAQEMAKKQTDFFNLILNENTYNS